MLSDLSTADFAARLDQAYLKVDRDTSPDELRQQVEQALALGFRSLCLPPILVATVKHHYPQLRVSMVVAYPLGMETTAAKLFAIHEGEEIGVDEYDVVLDLYAIKAKNREKLVREVELLVETLGERSRRLKLIVEAPILTDQELEWVVEHLKGFPVGYLKTSTGYGRNPTRPEQVSLMRRVLGASEIGIKASGGIRTLEECEAMFRAGAEILGVSRGPELVEAHRQLVRQTLSEED